MSTFRNQTVLIIGGSSGIGFHVAEKVAQQGGNLILVGRNADRLATAKESLSKYMGEVDTFIADAHDETAITQLFDQVPAFNHLVSMVGDVMGGGFMTAELSVIRHVIESKFFANVRIAQLAGKKIQASGSMVFTSGTGGRAHHACASYVGNMGINALVEGLAVELAPAIRVNAVSPTWTVTPFWRNMPEEQKAATQAHFSHLIPLGRTATMDELADGYIFMMQNQFVTGQHLAIDGGIMLGKNAM
ncbi:SDR family oxidoreductase [Leeia sp. TBRC 13508]|uniref:SDR family oxidoreductase n=1 Tax=Leeia speluncae TaxID=2884804 RepID=A0ABS8DA46_9NEIS|nr:SDR family oxidoreductase [Leeia speluncae]MCB6184888.1 SDR family oxidoreductase [Leeia speluncae]